MRKIEKYDLIIIGSGSGCLSAAHFSLCENKKVLLIEKGNKVGGYNSTFRAGRFSFEPDFRGIPASFLGQDLVSFIEETGVDVPYKISENAFKLIVTDGSRREYVLPNGIADFKAKIVEYCPEAEESINAFFRLCDQTYAGEKALAEGSQLNSVKKAYPDYIRAATYTLSAVEDYFDIPSRAREILNVCWCYLGLTPDKLDFSTYVLYLYTYIEKGRLLPCFGRADIDNAFIRSIKTKGGTVIFNTRVENIILEDGLVSGVVTDDGFTYRAPCVLTDVSDSVAYNTLYSEKPKSLQYLNSQRSAAQSFTVCLGLNRTFKELGLDALPTVILFTSDAFEAEESMQNVDKQGFLLVDLLVENGLPHVKLTALYKGNALEYVSAYDLKKREHELAALLLARFEKAMGISIRPFVEEYAIFSPFTYAKKSSAFGGSPQGLEPVPENSMTMRLSRDSVNLGARCVGVSGEINCFGADYLSAVICMRRMKGGEDE